MFLSLRNKLSIDVAFHRWLNKSMCSVWILISLYIFASGI